MHPEQNQFHFSFFRPSTESARRNRNMVVQFVLIWAVAIFGFQVLLRILEEPVPQEAYTLYTESWQRIQSGQPAPSDYQQTGRSALSVLAKVGIDPEHRLVLDRGLSWMAFEIAGRNRGDSLKKTVAQFEQLSASTADINEETYMAGKQELIPVMADLFGLPPTDVRAGIAPLEVRSALMGSTFDDTARDAFQDVMKLYLVHNRSVLTDLRFLGFPFHYFYTAVFLLVLFVGLCWLYCIRTDMFHKKYGVED